MHRGYTRSTAAQGTLVRETPARPLRARSVPALGRPIVQTLYIEKLEYTKKQDSTSTKLLSPKCIVRRRKAYFVLFQQWSSHHIQVYAVDAPHSPICCACAHVTYRPYAIRWPHEGDKGIVLVVLRNCLCLYTLSPHYTIPSSHSRTIYRHINNNTAATSTAPPALPPPSQ